MNLNNVPGDMLILTIDREVETTTCYRCQGDGKAWANNGKGEYNIEVDCPACGGSGHGTGRRKVRVQGWVGLDIDSDFESDFESTVIELDFYRTDDEHNSFYFYGQIKDLPEKLVTAFLDKTLPPEIADNLKEVECDE